MMIPSFRIPSTRRLGMKMPGSLPSRKQYLMRSDVKETDSMYILDIDLPGFAKEDIKAHVDNGYLCIEAGKVEQTEEKEPKNYIQKERFEGVYRRTFYIGTDVRQEDIKASYKHGVLRMNIPKKASADKQKPEEIQIA